MSLEFPLMPQAFVLSLWLWVQLCLSAVVGCSYRAPYLSLSWGGGSSSPYTCSALDLLGYVGVLYGESPNRTGKCRYGLLSAVRRTSLSLEQLLCCCCCCRSLVWRCHRKGALLTHVQPIPWAPLALEHCRGSAWIRHLIASKHWVKLYLEIFHFFGGDFLGALVKYLQMFALLAIFVSLESIAGIALF